MAARKKRKGRRGNFKFTAPDGEVWDSEFEWHVYTGLRDLGWTVRRCDKRDSITYHTPVQDGCCMECGGSDVVQVRSYTPDLWVVEPQQSDGRPGRGPYLIECKGYFPRERRGMLTDFAVQNPSLDLRFLFSKVAKLTAAKTNVEYIHAYLKKTAGAWNNGNLEWFEVPVKKRVTKRRDASKRKS